MISKVLQIFVLVLLVIRLVTSEIETDPFQDNLDEDRRKHIAEVVKHQCWMLGSCTHEESICGFDEKGLSVKLFENRCQLYKTNCKGPVFYQPIHMGVCRAKNSFMAKYYEMFQWTTEPAVRNWHLKYRRTQVPADPRHPGVTTNTPTTTTADEFFQWLAGKH